VSGGAAPNNKPPRPIHGLLVVAAAS
jgi:hypothetical protein